MNGGSEQYTDAANIKPVSSLRAQFEGLNLRRPSQDDNTASKDANRPLKPTVRSGDGVAAGGTRASFDAPRAESPWDKVKEHVLPLPRTPGVGRERSKSPTKSGHKRPMSMQIQQSPVITPSVRIESPRSPPKGYFFSRSGSRSPERVDNSPFGKVRELISQASSRSSTRPGTPLVETEDSSHNFKREVPPMSLNDGVTKSLNAPPPINRADKPRIPAKPTTFTVHDVAGAVKLSQSKPAEPRISPFNTPPSSEEERSPERIPGPLIVLHKAPAATIRQVSPPRENLQHHDKPPEQPLRPSDPRVTGFARSQIATERRDPRTMGLSSGAPGPPSRDASAAPIRANTVADRPLMRDARDSGLPLTKPTPRYVSENIRNTSPRPEPVRADAAARQPMRDARLMGFSALPTSGMPDPALSLTSQGARADPPQRIPEPSQRPLTTGPRQPSPTPPDRSTKPGPAKPAGATISLVTDSASVDPYFPPPPKRNMFGETDSPSPRAYRPPTPQKAAEEYAGSQSSLRREAADDTEDVEVLTEEASAKRAEYPDASRSSRRPPFFQEGLADLSAVTDSRTFDICGQYLCTTGYVTRVFDLGTGEAIMGLNHGQTTNLKVLSIIFKPGAAIDQEGRRLWIGNNDGELQEIDVATHGVIATSNAHNRRAVVRILRFQKDLWTLDDSGKLLVWPAHENGSPNLKYSHISHQVQKGHTFALVVKDKLWLATGKEIRLYKPGNEASFAPLTTPLVQTGTGEITSGTSSSEGGGRAYFGHLDGKVSMYSTQNYSCLGVIKVSDYKINGLAFVGDMLWVGYRTGKVYVYDTSSAPWRVKKDWIAHNGPVVDLLLDPSSVWTMRKLQVASLGHDNMVRFWDGMLERDWVESKMQDADVEYCSFREVRAAVVTWNVGASNPLTLKADFVADAIHAEDPPEILAFGFQEVVDLEDKSVATKGILGFGKKKDTVKVEQHQGGVYREWRDYLTKAVNRSTSAQHTYTELMTSHLIGLFQCIFIRQDLRSRVSNLCSTTIKTGMGGRYGNKGALVTRFVFDDSSVCFINCHLAAGQTQASHRNNDVATILEDESLPAATDPSTRSALFIGGGDGSQVLDHEICLLNGDLNYRIDTVPRDTVIRMIWNHELNKLLERDQICVSRRRVSNFRLGVFAELPITFPPTYKYDLHTDTYDTSEKKRSPAWCDRVLYRGVPGRVKQVEYRRHDGPALRVSDHRPVSGMFKMRVKLIDETRKEKVKKRVEREFSMVRKRVFEQVSVAWLVERFGLGEAEARRLIADG